MKIKNLTTPWQRSLGAMFKRNLGDTALVFAYPHSAPRLFHTAFCKPVRVIALADQGDVIFDRVVPSWGMVHIPPTRIVLEVSPEAAVTEAELRALALERPPEGQLAAGSWEGEANFKRLFFALLADAVADIRRVYEANRRAKTLCPGVLFEGFTPWERGRIVGSAALLLDGSDYMDIPENAVRMSRQILADEKQAGHIEELLAASVAGDPWKFPNICFKCEYPASWRPVFARPADMPVEMSWRYARPENHVPVCKRCAYRLKWTSADVRQELGYMIWGVRLEAFVAWQEGWRKNGWAESWDLEHYPLWPEACGGPTWALGSGALAEAAPRGPEGVYRREAQRALLKKYFPRGLVTRPFLTSPQPNLVGLESHYMMEGTSP